MELIGYCCTLFTFKLLYMKWILADDLILIYVIGIIFLCIALILVIMSLANSKWASRTLCITLGWHVMPNTITFNVGERPKGTCPNCGKFVTQDYNGTWHA